MKLFIFLFIISGEAMSFCLGRISLDLPNETKLTYSHSRIDDVTVELVESKTSKSMQSFRDKEVKQMDKQAKGSSVIEEKISEKFWIAEYKTRSRRKIAGSIRALVLVDGDILRLDSKGDETVLKEMRKAVINIAKKLKTKKHGANLTENSFCFPSSHFLNFSYRNFNESIKVKYTLANGDRLEIQTRTNGKKLRKNLLGIDFIKLYLSTFFSSFFDGKVQDFNDVQNDYFDGQSYTIYEGKESDREYVWRSVGRQQDPENPLIEVRLKSKKDNLKTIQDIVSSLRRVK